MKRFKNKLFAVLFAVTALVAFSSCENDDYEWREATMDLKTTITTSPNGVITANLPIGYDWVIVNNGRYDHIDDIKYYSGYITVAPNGYIRGFDLRVSNSNIVLPVDIRSNTGGRLDGAQVDDFLYEVVEVVRRYGSATIYVDGEAASSVRFDLNFYIDIDAYVRY